MGKAREITVIPFVCCRCRMVMRSWLDTLKCWLDFCGELGNVGNEVDMRIV